MTSPIEEIKARIDITELIGGYVRLHKAGSNFKALCPFHKEKTPSFNVSPTRQIWHCFGCSRGGDHFKFVMEIEGLDFPEALRLLAKRAGVELKKEDPRLQSERNKLYDLLEEAAVFFQRNIETVSAARAYLKKRGMTDKTAADFRVGFSFDSWDGLIRHLRQKKYSETEMEKAGLVVKSENGGWYDRFRSRIMFPVRDASGRVVGFGGRIFEPEARGQEGVRAEAKYINTPQTMVYDKSRVLYAFDKAKESIRRLNSCVIVEGYMDAVMSHQAGVTNAVAVSGTALTQDQLRTVRRLADVIISSFDRDSAGEAATKRSLDLAAEFDFERKAAVLPAGLKDPADAVLSDPEIWKKAVDGARPIVQFYFDEALVKHSKETPSGAKAIAGEVLPEVRHLSNEVEKGYWVRKLAQTLDISEESVWHELAAVKSKTQEVGSVLSAEDDLLSKKSRRDQLEELVVGFLGFSDSARRFAAELSGDMFLKDAHRDIFKTIRDEAGNDFSDALKNHANQLAFRAETFLGSVPDHEAEISSILTEFRIEHFKHRRSELSRRIAEAERLNNEAELSSLSKEFKQVCDLVQDLSIKTS